ALMFGLVVWLGPRIPLVEHFAIPLAAVPVVWLAKRVDALPGVTWRGLALITASVVFVDLLMDLFQVPIWQIHTAQFAVLVLAVRYAQRWGLMPPENENEA